MADFVPSNVVPSTSISPEQLQDIGLTSHLKDKKGLVNAWLKLVALPLEGEQFNYHTTRHLLVVFCPEAEIVLIQSKYNAFENILS